jgi:flagellar protein FliS
MFSMQSAVNAYSKIAVESQVSGSNAHQLITLLYDGAIEALKQARMHIEAKHIEQKGRLINKAISIINEGLLASLNVEAGGDLARNLAGLYDYMTFCLVTANRTNNVKPVDDVIKLLGDLREAWVVIDPQKTAPAQSTQGTTGDAVARQFIYS